MAGRQKYLRSLAASGACLAIVLFAAPAISFAGMHPRALTELTLEELLDIEVDPAARAGRPQSDTLAAIRAGCADGLNICDALRAVLASSTSRGREVAPQNVTRQVNHATPSVREASLEAVEYNAPKPLDPAMFAAPSHAAFGRTQTVDGAMRALGFGL